MRKAKIIGALAALLTLPAWPATASDHLDTPSVITDPRADIGDLYAWMSPDARRLNLAMTIVGHSFSPALDYRFHIDSAPRLGAAAATITIICRFPAPNRADCRAGGVDAARGDASEAGIEGRRGRMQVFAGLRDDPFFNNVRGSRHAYDAAAAALQAGTPVDAARCPGFDRATSQTILNRWRHTEGGPATNFLAGWTPMSLIISIDRDAINGGGDLLAIWATTASRLRTIDRMGRPLTGNALLGTLGPTAVSDLLKEDYNMAPPSRWPEFASLIAEGLALYDGFDGICGNQLLADPTATPERRYAALAALFADDRLWVNAASGTCQRFLAVERSALAGETALAGDCGGRPPNLDAIDRYRSLLIDGTEGSVSDGVDRDERPPSDSVFPFLLLPDGATGGRR